MADSKFFMFDNPNRSSSIDPGLLALMNNNGGFGGGNAMWLMFLWFLYPMMLANGGFGGWGNGANGNAIGTGYLANLINNNQGRDLLSEVISGRFDSASQLAQITHTSVENVRTAIGMLQSSIQDLTAQNGMSALQIQNAIQSGDAAISRQLCECCCENRLAIANQTATLQADSARNFAAQQLQMAQNHADDRLDVCQQTNELKTQSIQNTQGIKDAIAAQSIMINDKFCDLEKRELQAKINTQGDIITQLRGQLDNDRQTAQFYNLIAPLQAKVNEIAAKQPNTVPVQYPNLIAVNQTPYAGGYGYGAGYGIGFGGGVVL